MIGGITGVSTDRWSRGICTALNGVEVDGGAVEGEHVGAPKVDDGVAEELALLEAGLVGDDQVGRATPLRVAGCEALCRAEFIQS